MTPEEVKQARAALGLTQEQLARELDVTLSAVQAWEGGRRQPSGPVVKLLALLVRDKRLPR